MQLGVIHSAAAQGCQVNHKSRPWAECKGVNSNSGLALFGSPGTEHDLGQMLIWFESNTIGLDNINACIGNKGRRGM